MEDKNSNNMLKKTIAEERLKAVPDVAFGTAA